MVAFLGFGCAVARVSPDGTLYGLAIGEKALVERCVPTGEPGVIAAAPEACSRIVGAPLLPSLLDGLGSVLATAGKVLWGWIVP